MTARLNTPVLLRLLLAASIAALLNVPVASSAQTYWAGTTPNPITMSGDNNWGFGYGVFVSLTTGTYNIGIGADALEFLTSGSDNIGLGYQTLRETTTGSYNVAIGFQSMYTNIDGTNNNAYGTYALYSNDHGSNNNAFGENALHLNTSGTDNTAIGSKALQANVTGSFNDAIGYNALLVNTASGNDALGWNALAANTSGTGNDAFGYDTLLANQTGQYNSAFGWNALANSTGDENIALGYKAGYNLTTGQYDIDIANMGVAGESGTIRIGDSDQTATYIAGISGTTITSTAAVYVTSSGQLGVLASSRRFKKDIKDMGSVSDRLMQLRPVTFRYKKAAEDGSHPIQFGLIAEEVAKVCPDLVQFDKQGKPFTVAYNLLTPMLLNEMQKEHHQTDALKSANARQNSKIAELQAALRTQETEMASLRKSQDQQTKMLARLAASVQAAQKGNGPQTAALAQR